MDYHHAQAAPIDVIRNLPEHSPFCGCRMLTVLVPQETTTVAVPTSK